MWGSFFSRKHGRAMSQLSLMAPLKRIALIVEIR
jgi:hypothetical protein